VHGIADFERNHHSPIANLETSLSTILSNTLCCNVIDKDDCKRIFQIGGRRMLMAYFPDHVPPPEFVVQSYQGVTCYNCYFRELNWGDSR